VTNSLNIHHQTPLHHASINCDISTIKRLLDIGYDPLIKDKNYKTPLDLAKENHRYENYDFLNSFINSPEYKEQFLSYPLHQAVLHNDMSYLEQVLTKENVNARDFFDRSILYHAINMNNVGLVEKCLELNAEIENIDEFNQSALLIAIYNNNSKIIKLLLEHGADPNQLYYDRSYLYRAILKNNYEVVKLLIEYNANLNYID